MINIRTAKVLLLLGLIWAGSPLASVPQEPASRVRLAAILKKSEDYCRRLDKAALDFVCLEEVTETTRHFTPRTDIYLYDYQFVRKGGEAKERRNLVAVNGQKTDVRDAALDAVMFRYENALFGPVGLLSKFWQAYHKYELIGDDVVNGVKTVVIEATPGPVSFEPHAYGKLWVKENDGSVLKIVWDQRSLGNFRIIEDWAKSLEAEPQITAFTEYAYEKNGLRFPSRNYSEEAYVTRDKRKSVSAEISILYRDYKFFTVETDVKY